MGFFGSSTLDFSESSTVEQHLSSQHPLSTFQSLNAGTLQDPLSQAEQASWRGRSSSGVDTKLESEFNQNALIVNTTVDIIDPNDGLTSLREAINAANKIPGADIIRFDLCATPATITLKGEQLYISDRLAIQGPGADALTISGNDASRIFEIAIGTTVNITGLTLTHGSSTYGGAIWNNGTLMIANSILTNNSATSGGSIANAGIVTVIKSTISYNSATSSGGGIWNCGSLTVTDTMLSANSSLGLGGGIYCGGASSNRMVINSMIVDNVAATNGGGIYSPDSIYPEHVKPVIHNTTIARNSAGLGNPDVSGAHISLGGNLIGDSTGAWGFMDGIKGDQVGNGVNPLQPILNLTVDTLSDESDNNFGLGELSLREAVARISPGGTITFAPELRGVIELSLGELTLEKSVTIAGPSAKDLTISGSQHSRVFSIGSDTSVHINGLTITHRLFCSDAVGIHLNPGADLTLTNVLVKDSTAGNFMSGGDTFNLSMEIPSLSPSTLDDGSITISVVANEVDVDSDRLIDYASSQGVTLVQNAEVRSLQHYKRWV